MHCEKCGALLERKVTVEHGRDVTRDVCCECGFIRYGNPVPVVMAIVEQKGRICLARNHEWPEKFFGLISGFLEHDDESPARGMVRELAEELSVEVAEGDLRLVGVASFRRLNQVIVLYHVVLGEEVRVVANTDELAAIQWVPLSKFHVRWREGAGPLLKEWLKSRLAKL